MRPRWWLLVLAAAVLVLAAEALVAGARRSSGPASLPGTVTMTGSLPRRGTLWLTSQWTSVKGPGPAEELGGFIARFSTCHQGGFMDLRRYCTGLVNPYFVVLGVTPRGTTAFRLTTRVDPDNFAHGHRTAWIVPVDRRTGTLYRLAAMDDLIVQLWAINTQVGRQYKVGEIRG